MSGDNIIQKIDYHQLAQNFVNFFFAKWSTNPLEFGTNGLFFEKSKMNLNGNILSGADIVKEMINMANGGDLVFSVNKVQALDTGSRRVDILVTGTMIKNGVKYNFSNYILIIYQNETWKIQNSIINIFI
jgi:hypothetical protein